MDLVSKQQEIKCVICLNSAFNIVKEEFILRFVYLDSCNHSFCLDCITKWSQKSHQCPQCRTNFKSFYTQNIDSKINIKRYDASPIIDNSEDQRLMALADIDNTYYDLILQQIDFI